MVCHLKPEPPFDKPAIWRSYEFLTHYVRSLSVDGIPRNDWYLTYSKDYDQYGENPFETFVKRQKLPLPAHKWLVQKASDGEETRMPVYPMDQNSEVSLVSRMTFASAKLYVTHMMSALLWERDEDVGQVNVIYNADRGHNVQIRKTQLTTDAVKEICFLEVVINMNGIRCSKATPFFDTSVSVRLPEILKWRKEDRYLEGKVTSRHADNFDFTLKAELSVDQAKRL